ncbi:MAG: hypothetical protein M1826_004272 [Phylliscum demangeonii]|nr:MAG: hypothetical protein M1826_004272 [Phylliscum demangeonii]
MAPALASEYFPPLDKCLNGDDWLMPFTAYDKPTPQSRVQFDSRTSAINTTTSEASRKLIGQLQEDALWLSRSVQVDEVSALRVAVLEWQSRLEAQLFAGFSEEESASIQDVTAAQGLGSSMSLSTISVVPAFFSTSNVDLGSERKRRTYLLERRHFLKITEVLVRAGLSDTIWTSEGNASATWLEGIGKTILNTRCSGFDSFSGSEAFLLEAVNALRQCVLGLMNGVTGIVEDDEDDTDSIVIDVDWRKAHLLDMIHAMQIFFSIIDATNDIPPSSILLAWLRLVGEHSFFNGVFFVSSAHTSLIRDANADSATAR